MKKYFKKLINSDKFSAIIFLLPAILGSLIFIIIPIFFSFYLSFTDWDLLSDIKFVGLKNYINLFRAKDFYFILYNTIYFAIIYYFIFDKNEQKEKKTILYGKLINEGRTSPKWKSEAQLFAVVSNL